MDDIVQRLSIVITSWSERGRCPGYDTCPVMHTAMVAAIDTAIIVY